MEYLINEFFLIYVTSCHNHSLNSIIDKATKLMAHIFLKQKSYHIKKNQLQVVLRYTGNEMQRGGKLK